MTMIGIARLLRNRCRSFWAVIRTDEGDGSSSFVTDVLLPEISILALSLGEISGQDFTRQQADETALRRNLAVSNGLISSETAVMNIAREIGRLRHYRSLRSRAARDRRRFRS